MTITVASPASSWLSALARSRWPMPSLRPTAAAFALVPLRVLHDRLGELLVRSEVRDRADLNPAAPTWSPSAAASPPTVVPFNTATVTLDGSIGAPFFGFGDFLVVE